MIGKEQYSAKKLTKFSVKGLFGAFNELKNGFHNTNDLTDAIETRDLILDIYVEAYRRINSKLVSWRLEVSLMDLGGQISKLKPYMQTWITHLELLSAQPVKPVDPIDDAIAQFPATFGLRAFPGNVFRISQRASYVNDSKVVQLYTQIFTCDKWLDFAKGTVRELKAELVGLPVDPSAEFDGLMDIQIESPSIFLDNVISYLQTISEDRNYEAMCGAFEIIDAAKTDLENGTDTAVAAVIASINASIENEKAYQATKAAEWKTPRLESSLGTDSPEQEAIIAKTAEPTSEALLWSTSDTFRESKALALNNQPLNLDASAALYNSLPLLYSSTLAGLAASGSTRLELIKVAREYVPTLCEASGIADFLLSAR